MEIILIFYTVSVDICKITLWRLLLSFELGLGIIKYNEFLFFLIMKGYIETGEPELIKVLLRFIESGSELEGVF